MREGFGALMARNEGTLYPRVIKTVVYYAAVFFQGAASIVLPAASVILKSPSYNGFSDQQYGLLFIPMIVGGLMTTYGMPSFLKHWKIHKIFYAGIALQLIFLGMLTMAPGVEKNITLGFIYFLSGNFFYGLGSGLLLSVVTILVIDLYPDHRDPAVAGLHSSIGIGCAVTPILLHHFHLRSHWSVEAAVLLAGFSGVFLFSLIAKTVTAKDHPAPDPALERPHRGPLLPPWGVCLFLLSIVGYGVIESLTGNWSSVYLKNERAFSLETAAICLSLFWGFVTVGRVLTVFATLKMDSRIFYRLSPLLIALSVFFVLQVSAAPAIYGVYILLGLGCSCFFPLAVSLSTSYFDDWRHFLSSSSVAALMVGVAIGSTLVGSLREMGWFSLTQAFGAAFVCAVLMAAAGFGLTRVKPNV